MFRMIRLSIVIPSRGHDLTSCSRILQACSFAGPRVEVVVCDRSGNAAKAEFLRGIEQENCRFTNVSPGDGRADWSDALAEARGDFVLVMDDDDVLFDRAMITLPGVVESIAADASVIGIAAPSLIETPLGVEAFAYPNIDAADPLVRLSGYLSADKPNVLLFSPVRRATMIWALDILRERPLAFPFDDQLSSLLYLLAGKFARMTRLMHVHDTSRADATRSTRAAFYERAHLDPTINKLNWLLCGFEGATLIRHASLPSHYSPQQRQTMADLWFSAMFARFKSQLREAFGSPFSGEAEQMCAHLQDAAGRLSFADMLADICQFIALSSQESALKYFAYWSVMLGLRQAGAA
jgi:hypothetical protein